MKFFIPLIFAAATLSNALAANDAQNTNCAEPPAALVSEIDDLIARSPRIVLARHTPLEPLANTKEKTAPDTLDRDREIKKATQSQREPERVISEVAIARFDVLENLKGDGPDEVYVAKTLKEKSDGDETYNAHADQLFWDDARLGRVTINERCMIAPDFEIGAIYLIFVGQPHVKGYERIDDENDAWLSHVREAVLAME